MNRFYSATEDIHDFLLINDWDEFGAIFLSCMNNINVLSTAFCTIKPDIWNKEYINNLRQEAINFYVLYIKFMDITNNTRAWGIKHHFMWHLWEWCECYQCTPAILDDQRQEHIHQWIKKSSALYKRYGDQKELVYVVKDTNNKTLLT